MDRLCLTVNQSPAADGIINFKQETLRHMQYYQYPERLIYKLTGKASISAHYNLYKSLLLSYLHISFPHRHPSLFHALFSS